MMETIAIYYSPLASTKIAAYVGLGLAYHMALVHTNNANVSFGVSSGPSNQGTLQTPMLALDAVLDVAKDIPSAFGTLTSDPKNNHPFRKGYPEDYYTQDFEGVEYPHVIAMTGPDLSDQWKTIVATYEKIGRLHLTYSPVSQNSNSMAAAALREAGIAIPFSVSAKFAPGEFTQLPCGDGKMCGASGR